jgi:hypothetical protein
VILTRQGSHAQLWQFSDGRRRPLRIGRSVSNQQLEWSAGDSAGPIDVANGQFESSEQMSAGRDPARPGQWNESADPHARHVSPHRFRGRW